MPGEDLEGEEGGVTAVISTEGMPPEFVDMMQAEDERFATISALDTPPQDDKAKSELFSLLAAPFLRLLGFLPNAASSEAFTSVLA